MTYLRWLYCCTRSGPHSFVDYVTGNSMPDGPGNPLLPMSTHRYLRALLDVLWEVSCFLK